MTPALAEFLALVRRERDAWAAIADDDAMKPQHPRRVQAAHKRDVLSWVEWQAKVVFGEVPPDRAA